MWIGHVYHGKHWMHEIKSIKSRKTECFGEEFTGVTDINITDGKAHIEALHCDDFTREDYKELKAFITQTLQFNNYEYSRYGCDLQRKRVKK